MIGMNNLGWGLEMLALGMGTVFVLLFVLMVVLMAMGLLDRPGRAELARPGPIEVIEAGETESGSSDTAWMTIADASGLTPEQIAAISVAVAMPMCAANKVRRSIASTPPDRACGRHAGCPWVVGPRCKTQGDDRASLSALRQ